MAFSDESLKAKLSTLNETQDSIVSVSQWIMFHKRHADRIASYWLTRLRDSPPPKRLNYIYLVNDIIQNARARRRSEFPDAFSPLLPEAMQTAYRSAPAEIQAKIRRVIEVWRTRNVIETPIQEAIEARLDETDKAKGTSGKKTLMGNSLFTSSSTTGMPKELETLAPLQIAVTKATLTARPAVDTAQVEYLKLNDPAAVVPSPPVYAARLSSLMKTLVNAESSVSASIKARQALIADLEKILEINRSGLAKDEETYLDFDSRKSSTEAKKREVEDSIMRGLTSADSSGADFLAGNSDEIGGAATAYGLEMERPEFEALTPEPEDEPVLANAGFAEHQPVPSGLPDLQNVLAGFGDTTPRVRQSSGGQGTNGMSAKRRKMSHGDDEELVPDLGEMGVEVESFGAGVEASGANGNDFGDLDEDVTELLRQESGRI